jgi:hypothetical protein
MKNSDYLRPPATEEDARKAMERMVHFYGLSKEELLALKRAIPAAVATAVGVCCAN